MPHTGQTHIGPRDRAGRLQRAGPRRVARGGGCDDAHVGFDLGAAPKLSAMRTTGKFQSTRTSSTKARPAPTHRRRACVRDMGAARGWCMLPLHLRVVRGAAGQVDHVGLDVSKSAAPCPPYSAAKFLSRSASCAKLPMVGPCMGPGVETAQHVKRGLAINQWPTGCSPSRP